jgi:hypothetical protein
VSDRPTTDEGRLLLAIERRLELARSHIRELQERQERQRIIRTHLLRSTARKDLIAFRQDLKDELAMVAALWEGLKQDLAWVDQAIARIDQIIARMSN